MAAALPVTGRGSWNFKTSHFLAFLTSHFLTVEEDWSAA
jgi:hypothetical protein